MAKKKKVDMDSIQQTHGAVLSPTKSLFDRLAANKYGTADAAVYGKQLEGMSLMDLQYHAINVAQIRPGFDRNRLIASLTRRFDDYMFQQKIKGVVK